MSNINISVIIPIYNYSIYFPTCLNSIFNQELDNIEIILLNNSKNNIKELIDLYKKFDNIKIIHDESKDNKLDLNFAIKEANGEYVAFIGSNDFIKPGMLEKLFHECENNNLDIAICNSCLFDDLNNVGSDVSNYSSFSNLDFFKNDIFLGKDFLNFIFMNYSTIYSKLFRRSFLLKNDIIFSHSFLGNKFLLLDAFLKTNKISKIDEYLYVYRFNNIFINDFSSNDCLTMLNTFKLIFDKYIDVDYKNNILIDQSFINYPNPKSFFQIYKKIFSVIIICFNVEEYVGEAIESVIGQTLDFESSIEIVLVDGGSTDRTFEICHEFVDEYPNNIRILHAEKDIDFNLENLGIKYASGKYINFLEPTNCLKEDTLSNAYNFFETHFNEFSFLKFPIRFWGDDYLKFNESYNKIISVVIPCFNVEEYVGEAIESVIGQTLDFESSIEIVLVDDGSTDRTFEICQEFVDKYPDNIKLFSQDNNGQASARNLGLKHISGKYVNFLDADDKLMKDTFKNAYEFFERHYDEIDLVSFPMYFFGKKNGDHILNYKFKKNLVISLEDDWNYPQLSASSAVFKSNLFNTFGFDENLVSSEDSVMVNKILLEKRAYGVINNGGYCYRKRLDESSTIDNSIHDKKYYNDRLKGYFCELIDYAKFKVGFVPEFIQYLIIYDIKWMFLNDNLFSIFSSDELIEFRRNLRYIFANIKDEIILEHFKNNYPDIKLLVLGLKHDDLIINDKGIVCLKNMDHKLDVFNNSSLYIDIIEIKYDTLFISGLLEYSYYDKKDFEIILTKNSKEKYYPNYVTYSNRREAKLLKSKLSFDFEVPICFNDKIEINLVYMVDDEKTIVTLPIKFFNHARMSEICNYSIWNNYFIEFKDNIFFISKYSYFKLLKKEISLLIKIFKIRGPYWTSAIGFHFVYLILFIFFKNKNIWLLMDRQDRADDNAEHFFNYLVDVDDTKNKYFVISKNTKDYSRLSLIWKNILSFYSIKHRILYLFADKIISSQADEIIVNPFWGKNSKWYSGLLTSDKIFLQHGVAKDDMSDWLRKYDKNVKLLVTTSDIEANSFEDYNYNYGDGVVQVLGLPRYDNLSNESDNKQILIMPSWRRNLIHADNNQIQKSEYFLRFNSLINNKKFIDLAKSLGYKIIFKPHPNTFEYIDLFDRNDYVIIDDESNYQDLFNNSSLLITDYSSLAFDFAYIKKPIIYYQYGDDYHFHNNFFIYESMGFGEVIKDEDELINVIGEYLNNDCKIKDKYLKRSNTFYKFNDKHNCKRVYDAIKKIK